MIALFVILVVVGALTLGSVAMVASILFRVLFGLILLPFRLIGLILFVPFLILRGLVGAVFGLAMIPLAIISIPILIVGAVFFSLLTPLLPLLALMALVWLLAKTVARPRLI
jgi:hypothetical protein